MRRPQGLIGRLAVGASLVCLLLGLAATAEANSVVRRTSTGELQTLPYRQDHLALVMPLHHPLAKAAELPLDAALDFDLVGLHTNSSIHQAIHQAATQAGRSVKLRIHVTGLDAMCRMIANGLGLGVMPLRAFELMRATDTLQAVPLTDAWATRQLMLAARDFSTLPVTARLLVDHLRSRETDLSSARAA